VINPGKVFILCIYKLDIAEMKTDVIQYKENVMVDESMDILEQTVHNEYKYGFWY